MDISEIVKDFVVDATKKVSYEFSYLTGLGWNYKETSGEKSFDRRKEDRYHISKDNILSNFWVYPWRIF